MISPYQKVNSINYTQCSHRKLDHKAISDD